MYLHKKYAASGKGLSDLANDLRANGMMQFNIDNYNSELYNKKQVDLSGRKTTPLPVLYVKGKVKGFKVT